MSYGAYNTDRAEQCRLSGVDLTTYAHCEIFAFDQRRPRLWTAPQLGAGA